MGRGDRLMAGTSWPRVPRASQSPVCGPTSGLAPPGAGFAFRDFCSNFSCPSLSCLRTICSGNLALTWEALGG